LSKQITDSEGKFFYENMKGGTTDCELEFENGILDASINDLCYDGAGGYFELTADETKKLYLRMKEYYEKDNSTA
jgi:hypothetical protein